MTTAFVTHPDYLKHDAGPGHPERPQRVAAISEAVDRSPLAETLERVRPEPVDEEQLAAVHVREYVQHVRDVAAHGGGGLKAAMFVWPESYKLGSLCAGATAAASSAVVVGLRVRGLYRV